MIDDEADNASINTSKKNITAINQHIRNILDLFERNAYVGYTATPFANVFIPVQEQGDIFPRDFIINLPAPSNYIGPEQVFGFKATLDDAPIEGVLPIVCKIEDGAQLVPEGHTKKIEPTSQFLPNSLKVAIKCFVMTCAIRILRGQEKEHNSMLIHVTRYMNWQNHVFSLVQRAVDFYKTALSAQDSAIVKEFRDIFEGDLPHYKNYKQVSQEILASSLRDLDMQVQVHAWEDVEAVLYKAISKIQVKEINGGSGEALNYFDYKEVGLSVIAVGGDKLSRGLTLEGLSVSYFLRASKMYDTLMQMGRWFGYRKGYVDLCRLFTTQDLNEWFCHITKASEELRDEFDYMSKVAGSTPEKYALKVRTHPGVLQITASNKLRSAVELSFSFSGRLVETYLFDKDTKVFEHNFLQAQTLIKSLGKNDSAFPKSFVWRNVPASKVQTFFRGYSCASNLRRADTGFVNNYINQLLRFGELTNWSVALISKSNAGEDGMVSYLIDGVPTKVGMVIRMQDNKESNEKVYMLPKAHIISPDHEVIDLDEATIAKAKEASREASITKAKEASKIDRKLDKLPQYPSGEIVRNGYTLNGVFETFRKPQNPLLMLYSINPKSADLDLNFPIVGFAISFPKSAQTDADVCVSYAVQEQLRQFFYNDDDFEGGANEDEN